MALDFEKYHNEVTSKYLKAGKKLPKDKEDYLRKKMYQTSYRLYSVDKKAYERLEREGFSFSSLESDYQTKIWSHIFKNTEYMGIGHLAINHFKKIQKKKNPELIQYWPNLKTWIIKVENWAHGDMIASLYSEMLEEDNEKVYPTLKKWSKANSPWKRRMALVSLLYYYNCRRKVLPYKQIISLLEPQISIDHYYLQKAIGWTLRELTRAYPKETSIFLKKNATAISPTAFSAGVEKLPSEQKEQLKKVRKDHRTKIKSKPILGGAKVFCKVCPKWEIKKPERCSNTITYKKQKLYFCTRKCKERFQKKPKKFL